MIELPSHRRAIALLCGQLALRAALANGFDDLSFGRVIEDDARDDTMSNEIRNILDNYGMPRSVRRAPYAVTTDLDDSPGGAPPFMHKLQVDDDAANDAEPMMPWDRVPFQDPPPSPFNGPPVSFTGQEANQEARMPWNPVPVHDEPQPINRPSFNGPSVASIGQQSIYSKLDQYQESSGASGAQQQSTDVTYIRAPFDIGVPYIDTNHRVWVPITPTQEGAAAAGGSARAASVDFNQAFESTRIWVQAPFKIGKPNWDEKTKAVYVPYFSIPDPKPVYPPNYDDDEVEPGALAPEEPVKHPLTRTREAHKAKEGGKEEGATEGATEVEKKGWMGLGLKRNRTSWYPSRAQWKNPSFHRYHLNQPSYPYAVSYPPLTRWRSPPPMYSPYLNNRWPSHPRQYPMPRYVDYGVGGMFSDEAAR